MRCCKCGSSCSSRTAIKRIPTRIPASAGHAPKRPTIDPAIGGPVRSLPPSLQQLPAVLSGNRTLKANMKRLAPAEEKRLENNTTRVSPVIALLATADFWFARVPGFCSPVVRCVASCVQTVVTSKYSDEKARVLPIMCAQEHDND